MNFSKSCLVIIFIVLLVQLIACVNKPSLHINKRNLNKSEIDENIKNAILKLGIDDGDTIVNIGCGKGLGAIPIFKNYPNVYFILEDIKKKKIENDFVYLNNGTKKYFKDSYTFVKSGGKSIPLASNQYKKILCSSVLHKLDNMAIMLTEINRIMTADARLTIAEPICLKNEKDCPACKKPFLSKEQIIQIATSNDFKLIKSDTTNNTRPYTFQTREYNILIFAKKG